MSSDESDRQVRYGDRRGHMPISDPGRDDDVPDACRRLLAEVGQCRGMDLEIR